MSDSLPVAGQEVYPLVREVVLSSVVFPKLPEFTLACSCGTVEETWTTVPGIVLKQKKTFVGMIAV